MSVGNSHFLEYMYICWLEHRIILPTERTFFFHEYQKSKYIFLRCRKRNLRYYKCMHNDLNKRYEKYTFNTPTHSKFSHILITSKKVIIDHLHFPFFCYRYLWHLINKNNETLTQLYTKLHYYRDAIWFVVDITD